MAGIAEITRVFNGDLIKVIGASTDISVESDNDEFIAFTSALASCTTGHDFTAEFLSDAKVWIEFDGQYIRIHGPDCIAPHHDDDPHFILPKRWEDPFKQSQEVRMPIEKYDPDQNLEVSMTSTLSSFIAKKEWNKAYQAFFQLLPRMTSSKPLSVITNLTADPEGLSKSAKATIGVALFWLGLQTKEKRAELTKDCYLGGLSILKKIGLTKKHPAMAMRVKAHLADLYQQQQNATEEIKLRKQIIQELKMHDDAIHWQLLRILKLDPDADLEELGIIAPYPEKFLMQLANSYHHVNKCRTESHVRTVRLQEYHSVSSTILSNEIPLILEGSPNQDIYNIFPNDKYPNNVLLAIAATYQKQNNTEKEIEARVMALQNYHSPDSEEFRTQISRILEADPTFDPHSIYDKQLPQCALLHIANIYKIQENAEAEIATRCMVIRLYTRTRTHFSPGKLHEEMI